MEKPRRVLFICVFDDNRPHNAVLARRARLVHNVQVVKRRRLAHRPRLDGEPLVVVCEQHTGFRLAESVGNGKPSRFLKAVENLRVERLARRTGVVQCGKVVLCQVFLNQKTVDGGGSAKCRQLQPLHCFQRLLRVELLCVVRHDDRAANPLSVNFAPAKFCPAGIRHHQVQAAVLDTVPVVGRDNVPQRVFVVVQNHFGHTGGAGREVDQHRVAIACRVGRFCPVFGRRFQVRLQRAPTVRHVAQYAGVFQRCAVEPRFVHVFDNLRVVRRANHLYIRRVAAVHDILGSQLERCGDHHRAQLVQPHHQKPDFGPLLEHQQHHVAFADALCRKHIGGLVAHALDVAKRKPLFVAVVVAPDQCGLVLVDLRPRIHNVIPKVKTFGYVQLVIFLEILITVKFYLFD